VPSRRVGSFSSGWMRFNGERQPGQLNARDPRPATIVRTTSGRIVDGADGTRLGVDTMVSLTSWERHAGEIGRRLYPRAAANALHRMEFLGHHKLQDGYCKRSQAKNQRWRRSIRRDDRRVVCGRPGRAPSLRKGSEMRNFKRRKDLEPRTSHSGLHKGPRDWHNRPALRRVRRNSTTVR
jgi:hypothetical protein